jgi:hypothetical protein
VCSGPAVLNAEAARQTRHAPQELVAAVREQQRLRLQLAPPEESVGWEQQQQQQRGQSGGEEEDDDDECCWSRLKRREQEECCEQEEELNVRSPKRCLVATQRPAEPLFAAFYHTT